MSQRRPLNIGIVCGEHSGDRLGSAFIKEIKKHSEVNLYGVGGPKLIESGLRPEFNFSEINIMGLVEPLFNYRRLSSLRNSLIKLFINQKIDYFIGIDSPDFNMGIHKALKKKHDNKNIQIVSPSVWAWRQNRIKNINAYIDTTLCLFNFEDKFYKDCGHKSLHLGHPFADLYKTDRDVTLQHLNLNRRKKYISICPGSRKSEIKEMLPTYIKFIKSHSKENKEYEYLVPAVDSQTCQNLRDNFATHNLSMSEIHIEQNSMKEYLSVSELSLVTSGTATLESAVLGCPPIICYKTNFINYAIISRMLRIKNFGLPNLLLGKKYFPELLQNQFTKENILEAVKNTTTIKKEYKDIPDLLRELLRGIGNEQAAKEIISL